MFSCDHFIYTSAKTDEKEGYQIIAKSNGISNEILSELSGYYYPIGTNLEKFQESRSQLIFKNKIAYSIIKNIGVGYDARRGTLYNHTFIFDKEDFEKIENDSRIFDNYFIEDSNLSGKLEPIQIKSSPVPIDFSAFSGISEGILNKIFHGIISKKKIAYANIESISAIQNLLVALPMPMRLLSFSTLVTDTKRQTTYDFIQIPYDKIDLTDKRWTVVGFSNKDDSYIRFKDVTYFSHIIYTKNKSKIHEFNTEFNKIEGESKFDKFKLLNYENLSKQTTESTKKARYYLECAKAASKLHLKSASVYLNNAKKYAGDPRNPKLLAKINTEQLLQSTEDYHLGLYPIENILKQVEKQDPYLINKVLKNILNKRKNEVKEKGVKFLDEVAGSRSKYQENIFKIFITTKRLNPQIIKFLKLEDFPNINYEKKIQMVIKLCINNNFELLENILTRINLTISSLDNLKHIKKLVHEIYPNPVFCNDAPPELILALTKTFSTPIDNFLEENIVKNDKLKLLWNSDLDFYQFQNISFDILDELTICLNHLSDFRADDVNSKLTKKIISEKTHLDDILKKIQNTKFQKQNTHSKSDSTPALSKFDWFWWLR